MASKTAQQLPVMTVQEPTRRLFRPEGWGVVEVEGVASAPEKSFEIELAEFLHDGESFVDGETMLKRAEEMGDLVGELHAEWIWEGRDTIQVEYRAFVLVIAGVVRSNPDGRRHVLCLYWCGDRWDSDWLWLEFDFNSNYRVVRLSK